MIAGILLLLGGVGVLLTMNRLLWPLIDDRAQGRGSSARASVQSHRSGGLARAAQPAGLRVSVVPKGSPGGGSQVYRFGATAAPAARGAPAAGGTARPGTGTLGAGTRVAGTRGAGRYARSS